MKDDKRAAAAIPRYGRVLALAAAVSLVGADIAAAAQVTVYTKSGAKVVIDTDTIAQPTMYYTVAGAPYWVYPTHPAYVPAPAYAAPVAGVAGTRGVARRTARRTTRRVDRRW